MKRTVEERSQRMDRIWHSREQGLTLDAIAKREGVSRTRITQLLANKAFASMSLNELRRDGLERRDAFRELQRRARILEASLRRAPTRFREARAGEIRALIRAGWPCFEAGQIWSLTANNIAKIVAPSPPTTDATALDRKLKTAYLLMVDVAEDFPLREPGNQYAAHAYIDRRVAALHPVRYGDPRGHVPNLSEVRNGIGSRGWRP